MSGYIRTIRGIERTASYTPIHATSRYAAYSLPAFEQTMGGGNRINWSSSFSEAADSAATWLLTVHQAQRQLDTMLEELGRDDGIVNHSVLRSHVESLVSLIQTLELTYKKHQDGLIPEIWGALELALRHPAMEELSLRKLVESANAPAPIDGNKTAGMQRHSAFSASADEEMRLLMHEDINKLRRLLLGADGLLHDIKRALTYAEQRRPLDLLRLPFTSAYPYALYYGAMQTYWPLPHRGLIFNKYI